jgi:hypothetical protein
MAHSGGDLEFVVSLDAKLSCGDVELDEGEQRVDG